MAIKFTDNSQKFLSAYPGAIYKAVIAIGAAGEKHAKAGTPVDTGRLRNSMAHVAQENAAIIGTAVEYGPYAELGTRNMSGHHMIQNACQNHSAEYKAIAVAALKSY